jgi:glutamyl-tRNA reductase
MQLFCLGLSHHTAAVSLRERFAVSESEMPAVLAALRDTAGLREAVLLSTCNRVEIYGACTDTAVTIPAAADFLRRRSGQGAPFYRLEGGHAVRHVFRVAAGLDSMVLGETEILGQVKDAYAAAFGAGHTAGDLNHLFQQAFRVAKRVRTETSLGRGSVSVGSAAARLASSVLGDLSACRALLLGAGQAGEGVARSFCARGLRELLVANRTATRAEALAGALGGQPVGFAHWRDHLATADIVIASAAASERLLSAGELAPVLAVREGRPLFLLDLAVPRDFDPGIRHLPGVVLHDVDALEAIAEEGESRRAAEVGRAEALVTAEAGAFAAGREGVMAAAA